MTDSAENKNSAFSGKCRVKLSVESIPMLKELTPKQGKNAGQTVSALTFKGKVISGTKALKGKELGVEFYADKATALSEKITLGMELYVGGYARESSYNGRKSFRLYADFAAPGLRDLQALDFGYDKEEPVHSEVPDHGKTQGAEKGAQESAGTGESMSAEPDSEAGEDTSSDAAGDTADEDTAGEDTELDATLYATSGAAEEVRADVAADTPWDTDGDATEDLTAADQDAA